MGFSTSELARRSNGQITRSAIALIEDGRVDARMVCSITQTWTF